MKMYEICFWVPGKFFKAIQYIRLAKPWPVERWFLHPIHTRWCPSERFIAFSWGPHNSNFTMVYGRYLYLLWFINQLITGGAPPCSIYSILDIKSTYTSHASNLLDYHIVYVHIQVDSLFYTYIYI